MAGTWSAVQEKRGQLDGDFHQTIGYEYAFTADASAATIPDKVTESVAGAIVAIRVKFDGDTPPDALTVTVKDPDGATIATEAFTASGYVLLDKPMWFVPGQLTISCEGNSTNSAEGSITVVLL